MAEETTPKKEKPEFLSVPANTATEVPAPASKQLTWHGANGEELRYTVTAAHVDVREDAGALIGKMFSLS